MCVILRGAHHTTCTLLILCHCIVNRTNLDRILWITLLTHGALGSKQTSWPVIFRVALQRQQRGDPVTTRTFTNVSHSNQSPQKYELTKSQRDHYYCFWHWDLHDLSFLAVGVGRYQLHFFNVPADGFALGLDAAAVQLHSQAPQSHPC